MDDSTNSKLQLLCIVTDEDLKVCGSSFAVTVPTREEFGGVISLIVEVVPSLKDMDHGRFRLYKPPSGYPIRDSHSLDGLQLMKEHLTDPLYPPYKVEEKFREKGADHDFDIDVIVRVNFAERAGTSGATLHQLPVELSHSFLPHITFQLPTLNELQSPPDDILDINGITELARGGELPGFVQQLEEELDLKRTPRCESAALPLLGSLKTLLGGDYG
ncbi:hypothetical protein EDB84DRAFT_1564321 [Lactarius hengduanensis]|nr:hypothetical protein EDB84DRAFT_1564321 [Lactarius hengduanensis]